MTFSLTYAGEHYVLDALAGAAYALVIVGAYGYRGRFRGSQARTSTTQLSVVEV
jgi:hypothetical protein